jgi:hypothetical protein
MDNAVNTPLTSADIGGMVGELYVNFDLFGLILAKALLLIGLYYPVMS